LFLTRQSKELTNGVGSFAFWQEGNKKETEDRILNCPEWGSRKKKVNLDIETDSELIITFWRQITLFCRQNLHSK